MDLAKITEYNPRVARVEPGSGEGKRAAGVSYRCHLVGGAHCCTEEDIEIVPMERLVTRMVDDTLGLTARLKDYTVETTLTELDARTTRVTMSHFYSTPTLGSHLLNWLARDKISRNTEATLLSSRRRSSRRQKTVRARRWTFCAGQRWSARSLSSLL